MARGERTDDGVGTSSDCLLLPGYFAKDGRRRPGNSSGMDGMSARKRAATGRVCSSEVAAAAGKAQHGTAQNDTAVSSCRWCTTRRAIGVAAVAYARRLSPEYFSCTHIYIYIHICVCTCS